MSAELRSASAPLVDDSGDGAHSDAGSVPSTLYARCAASSAQSVNARRLRQAADNDVQFLQNRLKRLKIEEEKAKAEIDKLRRKTEEVSATRERHTATSVQRRQVLDQVDYGKRREAALIALNKERQAKAVWSAKQKILLHKRESALTMRKQKEINECRAHIIKEEQRDKNTRQRESIRQLHVMAKTRREREREARREEVREQHEARIEAEQQERVRKERLAAQLVAQEAQIIYRLKRLHQEKHAALRDLASTVEAGYGDEDGDDFHDHDDDRQQQQEEEEEEEGESHAADRRRNDSDADGSRSSYVGLSPIPAEQSQHHGRQRSRGSSRSVAAAAPHERPASTLPPLH